MAEIPDEPGRVRGPGIFQIALVVVFAVTLAGFAVAFYFSGQTQLAPSEPISRIAPGEAEPVNTKPSSVQNGTLADREQASSDPNKAVFPSDFGSDFRSAPTSPNVSSSPRAWLDSTGVSPGPTSREMKTSTPEEALPIRPELPAITEKPPRSGFLVTPEQAEIQGGTAQQSLSPAPPQKKSIEDDLRRIVGE